EIKYAACRNKCWLRILTKGVGFKIAYHTYNRFPGIATDADILTYHVLRILVSQLLHQRLIDHHFFHGIGCTKAPSCEKIDTKGFKIIFIAIFQENMKILIITMIKCKIG